MLTMTAEKVRFLRPATDRFVSEMGLFKSCSELELQQIEKYMVERRFAKNEAIFMAEESAEMIWFVKNGFVKEVDNSCKGRSQILSFVGVEGMFGTSAFSGGKYGCYALSETKAEVIAFPIRVFQSFMDKHPALGRGVLFQFSKYLLEAKDMHSFATECVEKRILHALMKLREQFGNVIRLTRKEIGEVAGASTETVIRVLTKTEARGIISGGRGLVTIKNTGKLLARMREI